MLVYLSFEKEKKKDLTEDGHSATGGQRANVNKLLALNLFNKAEEGPMLSPDVDL